MASHELHERVVRSQLPSDWEGKYLHDTHYGEQAAKVASEKTKVRVSIPSKHDKKFRMLIKSTQRVFNFAQIFFFALTYMSSWETMAL
jgi:hypothetical protein